jgi:DNA-binding MarR family transcriptional regulator
MESCWAYGLNTLPNQNVAQAIIGKMAGLDRNIVSQIIRGLEQKELITREKSSDERAKKTF